MQAVTHHSKLKGTEVFGLNVGSIAHSSMLSADFRNADTLLEPINFVRRIVIFFNVSTRRIRN